MINLLKNRANPSLVFVGTLIVVLLLSASLDVSAVENFGRLFTTAKQRKEIDEFRNSGTGMEVTVNDEDLLIDEEDKEEEVSVDALTVRGLVRRTGKKNTAWINDSNTYQGDLGLQYMKIDEQGISEGGININLPGEEEKIRLKVGQTYEPQIKQIKEIGNDSSLSREAED